MNSMTGFGRFETETDGKKMTVELKSVNHRFLDINIRMPRTIGFAEEHIRNAIKNKLSRGRVDVFINYAALGEDAKKAQADIGLIRSFVDAARSAGKAAVVADDLQLSHIIRIPDAITIVDAPEDEAAQLKLIDSALSPALDALADMREREGAAMLRNITSLLEALQQTVIKIEGRKDSIPKDYSEKLKTRISELLAGECNIDETRFNTEIAYMADKADINEEIVRLNTHIKQFSHVANSNSVVGRKLDFMVQEMNRELNTIGSKAQDIKITNAVIDGKSIVEKIREQVQNIE